MAYQQPRRRRHIRWDRVTVAAVILVILIFLLGSCVHSCGKHGDETSDPQQSGSSQASGVNASAGNGNGSADSGASGEMSGADPAADASGADLPSDYQYVTTMEDAVHKGTLILVNGEHPSALTKDDPDLIKVSTSADRPSTYAISYPGKITLDKTAVAQFNRLMRAYYSATENAEIMFNYGYLESGVDHSNAESATGLDVQLHLKLNSGSYDYISYISPYTWLFDHMASYGYILRYPQDKTEQTGERATYTAIRYVGVPHAAYIEEHNLCLEEYLQMLKDEYQFGQSMLEYSTSEQTYQIYYVPASASGDTAVPVPTSGTWDISGNNVDGFIVTAYAG